MQALVWHTCFGFVMLKRFVSQQTEFCVFRAQLRLRTFFVFWGSKMRKNQKTGISKMKIEISDCVFRKLYFAILVLCAALYCVLLGGKYVWADEAYSFAMIQHSYAEIWKITAADVHPPLYYYILKFLTQPFGYSLLSAKIVSILPYLFIIAFGGIQFKQLFGKNEALSFMILFFLFPFSLGYSVEVRMYSWAAAFVFGNAVFAYRCFIEDNKHNWFFFALFGACSAYTHYYALVSTGIVYGLLLLVICIKGRKKLCLWLIFSALTVILYLPWLKSFIEQLIVKVNNEYWIAPISLRTVIDYGFSIFGGCGSGYLSLLFASVYLFALIGLIFTKNKDTCVLALCSLAVPVGTIAVGILASILVRPVFVIRYLVPAIPLLVTFLVLSFRNTASNYPCIVAICLSLIVGIFGYGRFVRSEYQIVENALDQEFVAQFDTDAYLVLTESGHIPSVLSYYDPITPIYRGACLSAANPFENYHAVSEFNAQKNDSVILLVDVGEDVPEEYASKYHGDYLGELNECGNLCNAYLLTKAKVTA